ncbi:hypothetical protein Y032_0310g2121 [Ancylostoma ceylanicum]|uniref:Uncharacterized protein n=1 Tax=Ancylostoma ceylanicum TaxID=53326 RepID=A0A016S3H6_9BILA|nr:hypothetical protein Y032_0310g2121 [Ancylostoma ceylanicum]
MKPRLSTSSRHTTIFKTLDETIKSGLKKKRSSYCSEAVMVPLFASAERILLIIGEGVTSSYRPIFLEAFEVWESVEVPSSG